VQCMCTDCIACLHATCCLCVYTGATKDNLQSISSETTTTNGDKAASSVQRVCDLASMRKALATSKNSRVRKLAALL
jgi:hypothetical protein